MTLDEALCKLETRPIETDIKKDNDTIRKIIKLIYDDYDIETVTTETGHIPSFPEFGRYSPNTKIRLYVEEVR